MDKELAEQLRDVKRTMALMAGELNALEEALARINDIIGKINEKATDALNNHS